MIKWDTVVKMRGIPCHEKKMKMNDQNPSKMNPNTMKPGRIRSYVETLLTAPSRSPKRSAEAKSKSFKKFLSMSSVSTGSTSGN